MKYKKTFRSKEEQKALVEAFLKQTKSISEYARLNQIPESSFSRYLKNYDNPEAKKVFKPAIIRTEDEKKSLVIKFAQSDEAIISFCRQNEIAYSSFYRFLNKFNDIYITEREKYEQSQIIKDQDEAFKDLVVVAKCDSLLKSAKETLESCEAIQKSQIKIALATTITIFIFLMIYFVMK